MSENVLKLNEDDIDFLKKICLTEAERFLKRRDHLREEGLLGTAADAGMMVSRFTELAAKLNFMLATM